MQSREATKAAFPPTVCLFCVCSTAVEGPAKIRQLTVLTYEKRWLFLHVISACDYTTTMVDLVSGPSVTCILLLFHVNVWKHNEQNQTGLLISKVKLKWKKYFQPFKLTSTVTWSCYSIIYAPKKNKLQKINVFIFSRFSRFCKAPSNCIHRLSTPYDGWTWCVMMTNPLCVKWVKMPFKGVKGVFM